MKDHEDHMREILEEALTWFCNEKRGRGQFGLKLEARYVPDNVIGIHSQVYSPLHNRFGRVLWKKLPEDVVDSAFKISDFAQLCFSDPKHSRLFNTK